MSNRQERFSLMRGVVLMPGALLLLASITVALPPFDVERAAGLLSQRVPDIIGAGVQTAHCAEPMPPARMSQEALADFAQCTEHAACLGDVGRRLGFDFVVSGHIVKLDADLTILLTVFDVHTNKVTKHLEQHYEGPLSGLEAALQGQVPELCKIVNPALEDPNAAKSLDDELSFQTPKEEEQADKAPPPPPPPPAAPTEDDLGAMMVDAAPKASAPATPVASSSPPVVPTSPPVASASPPVVSAPVPAVSAPPPAPPQVVEAPPVVAPATAAATSAPVAATAPPATAKLSPAAVDDLSLPDFEAPSPTPPPPPVVQTPQSPGPAVAVEVPTETHTVVEPPKVVAPAIVEPPTIDIAPHAAPEATASRLPPSGRQPPAVARRVPWGAIVAGAAVAVLVTGIGLGAGSQGIWSGDHTTPVDGISQNTVTHQQAFEANRLAAAADVMFGIGAAASIGAGVLIYVNGGLGISGHF